MPPRLDEGFLRAIRARVAEMPEQRFSLMEMESPLAKLLQIYGKRLNQNPNLSSL